MEVMLPLRAWVPDATRCGAVDIASISCVVRLSRGLSYDTDVERELIITTLPHMDFGDAECCGCLNGIIADGLGKVVCNECGEVLRCVPPAELEATLVEMENGLDVVVDACEYCGTV
jgi:hypothetical protein